MRTDASSSFCASSTSAERAALCSSSAAVCASMPMSGSVTPISRRIDLFVSFLAHPATTRAAATRSSRHSEVSMPATAGSPSASRIAAAIFGSLSVTLRSAEIETSCTLGSGAPMSSISSGATPSRLATTAAGGCAERRCIDEAAASWTCAPRALGSRGEAEGVAQMRWGRARVPARGVPPRRTRR